MIGRAAFSEALSTDAFLFAALAPRNAFGREVRISSLCTQRSAKNTPRWAIINRAAYVAALEMKAMQIASDSVSSLLDRLHCVVGFENLPNTLFQLVEYLAIGLMKQTHGYVQARIESHGNNPVGGGLLRSVANIRKSNPESAFAPPDPHAPAVVFLHRV